MIRSIWSFLFVLLTLAAGRLYGQEALPNALLWEISGEELETPSYLYGTIHMIAEKDFFMAEAVKQALAASDKVTFEINMESMNDFGMIMGMMTKAFMANDTTLRDLLSEEEYALISERFQELGLPLMLFQRIKPMFLSALVSDDFSLTDGGGPREGVASYEMELMKIAQGLETPIDGLETVDFQMSMFDSIPYRAQARMLVEGIKSGEEGDDQTDTLVLLYKQQDLQGMEALFKADASGMGAYEDLLLTTRNRNWIPVMERMMEEGPTFFAVGAGHLVGNTGVIRLLEAEGYTLRPIPFDWPAENAASPGER